MIINADMRDLLPDLCAAHFDVLITDPPYGDHVHDKAVSVGAADGVPVHPRDFGFNSIDEHLRTCIAALAGSCDRWGVVFCDIESVHLWRNSLCGRSLEYVRSTPWIRWSQPQLSGDRPPSGCEMIVCVHRPGRKHWNGPGSLTHFDSRCLRGAEKYSCEKPLDLMLDLVSFFSDPGETIVDPCAGIGTTALAARLLGRDCVAIELAPDVAQFAAARLDANRTRLSDRDQERARRWVDRQRAWLHDEPQTKAGKERYERATEDTNRVETFLRIGA